LHYRAAGYLAVPPVIATQPEAAVLLERHQEFKR